MIGGSTTDRRVSRFNGVGLVGEMFSVRCNKGNDTSCLFWLQRVAHMSPSESRCVYIPVLSALVSPVLQVLQNNAKYQVVPKKLTIGKRLAQCLHPALPSGVHRKALETYEIIFKIIGPKRLAKDLFVYRSTRPAGD